MASKRVIELKITPLEEIEIGSVGERSIIQNIRNIITTWRGSVPLDRDFGLDSSILDSPQNTVFALLQIDIMEQINKYEPRVEVLNVSFNSGDALNGEVCPLLRIRIK